MRIVLNGDEYERLEHNTRTIGQPNIASYLVLTTEQARALWVQIGAQLRTIAANEKKEPPK